MTTHENDHERHPDWHPPCKCGVCHTCLPALRIPPNIELGSE